jgi:polysaccharide deacetylase family protein (PEP-CTERM system associated)
LTNYLTFDIEDWHQLVEWTLNGSRGQCSPHVIAQTRDILETLAARGIRATFFILGLVAEAHPSLVREIAAAGHEVGSHGWSHELIYRQSRDQFTEETRRSKAVLEDTLGTRIDGYRAAEFSITTASLWALEVLAECGFTYDSSIFPVAGRRYGIDGTPLTPHAVGSSARTLTEVPLTAAQWRGRRWPVGGGGYFRLFPYALTRAAVQQANAEGRAANIYFHPYEFSRDLLIPSLTSAGRYLASGRYVVLHNVNRNLNRRRFARLLRDFQFAPIIEVLNRGR